MSWFGIGGSKNPLDNIEVPKDQLPPEVEKPANAKDLNKAMSQDHGQMLQMGSQFQQLTSSLGEFSKMATELKRSGEFDETMKLMQIRESTMQDKYKLDVEDRKLQIEQIKAQAQREETNRMKQKLEKEHELNMKKAQYEDQLRQKRKDQELQKEIQAQQRIEEAKRATIKFQQEEEMKNEEKKAMIHARAQAQVERENHELRMEQTRAEAKEKSKAAEKIAKINSEHYWAAAGRLMRNEDGMLTNMTKAAAGITVCGFACYFVMREAMRQVGARVMKPSLVQETSRLHPAAFWKRIRNRNAKPPQYIFSPAVKDKVDDITLVTRNVVKNNTNHRNVLLYGPPGTGKTLYAKSLAKESNMNYAIMSGGDVAPLGSQATYELNKLFDWSGVGANPLWKSKGTVLFIDEAEAFLRPRDENMSTDLRSVINTFLARTGEPSNRMQIVLATNQVNQLDPAVLDRMNELLEIPLPGLDERTLMLKQYLISHVVTPTQESKQRVKLDPAVVDEFAEICGEMAETTEGMSGREIEKMCGNVYASAVSKEDDPVINKDVLLAAALEYRSQSDAKARIRASRESK